MDETETYTGKKKGVKTVKENFFIAFVGMLMLGGAIVFLIAFLKSIIWLAFFWKMV